MVETVERNAKDREDAFKIQNRKECDTRHDLLTFALDVPAPPAPDSVNSDDGD